RTHLQADRPRPAHRDPDGAARPAIPAGVRGRRGTRPDPRPAAEGKTRAPQPPGPRGETAPAPPTGTGREGRRPAAPGAAPSPLPRPAELGPAQDAPGVAAVAVDRFGTRPALLRPAHPAGLHIPVEVPRDVPVQLPEPVLDPLVPRIRIRGVAPDRRVRRGVRGGGPHFPRKGGAGLPPRGRDPDPLLPPTRRPGADPPTRGPPRIAAGH